MSVINEIREQLPEEALVFDDPAYDNSIIGYSYDGHAIYDFDLMIEELMNDDGITSEEALEFIDYNTLGTYPPHELIARGYLAPIVVYRIIK